MKKVKNVLSQPRPLSYYELNVLLPILMRGLKMKKEKMNAVTKTQMVQGLRNQGLRVNCASVKRVINYIRVNDLIVGLMGSVSGYYIISSEQEFREYENTLLLREVSLRKVRMSIERQRKTMFTEDQKVSHRQRQLF